MNQLVKGFGRLILSLVVALAFGYGYYGFKTYVEPLSQNNFRQAMTSVVADETEVLLNGAAHDYEQGKTKESIKVLELALEKLIDKSGRYQHWKLERIYFLLGKSYQREKKFDKAAENYIETLRLNPNHLQAKYNLEMIQPPPSGGGGGGDEPKAGRIPPKI
jgi:tetratricopeptide (TPR) repeat protein